MTKKYLLAEETISKAELRALADWLAADSVWLTQGPLVREFEAKWASWLGRKYAVFVNSGSSANLLMYYSLLLSKGLRNRKVIVPAVSWATTVAPAIQFGFEPIMCDADPQTFGLDLNHLEALLQQHEPGAVIVVHVLGCPNAMDDLLRLKERYGFALMEDCCAAHGSKFDDRKVGSFGEMSTFSFYFGHHMSTIEGGMICTDSDELRDLLYLTRSHGWAKDIPPESEASLFDQYRPIDFNRVFTFYVPGFNVRSSDLNAKLGLMQLQKLDDVIARRVANHRAYQSRFQNAPGFHCQRNDRGLISSISFVALAESAEHRMAIARSLKENAIETRPLGGGNMSRQPFWKDRFGSIDLPFADRIERSSFQLPNHLLLSTDDVHHICDVVLSAGRA